jgi:hypothetical protein
MFEDAGTQLFLGQLDPRVLISYFPELRGSLFASEDGADVFAGALRYMPQDASVDDLSESLFILLVSSGHPFLDFLKNPSPCTISSLLPLGLILSRHQPSSELLATFIAQYSRGTGNRGAPSTTSLRG